MLMEKLFAFTFWFLLLLIYDNSFMNISVKLLIAQSHLDASDKVNWKGNCSIKNLIVMKICQYSLFSDYWVFCCRVLWLPTEVKKCLFLLICTYSSFVCQVNNEIYYKPLIHVVMYILLCFYSWLMLSAVPNDEIKLTNPPCS